MTTKSEGMMTPSKLKWYVILALALWLAFSGVAAAEQFYVNESGWWRDGGAFNASTAPIQAAVDAAGEGDAIYVWNGSYIENVDVNKQLTLEGEGADVVSVSAVSQFSVFEVTADCVSISKFTISGAGIYLHNANHCDISNNTVSNTDYGIYLYHSSNNTLTRNIASNNWHSIDLLSSSDNTLASNTILNSHCGIGLSSSNRNTLIDNTVSSNWRSIDLSSSSNNMLTGNIANSNNYYGISVSGSDKNEYNNSIDTTNIVNGKPVYYFFNKNGIVLDGLDVGHLTLAYCSDCTIKNNNVSNGDSIRLFYSSSNILQGNTASSNWRGIHLSSSSNNTLIDNIASNNGDGICLASSSNNTLTGNIANSNKYEGISILGSDKNYYNNSIDTTNIVNGKPVYYLFNKTGIVLDGLDVGHLSLAYCSDCKIKNNNASNSDGIRLCSLNNSTLIGNTASSNNYGIYLFSSNNNTLTGNTAKSNNWSGIHLSSSSDNTLTDNIASNNGDGICLASSSNNMLSGNTASSNSYGIYLRGSSNNTLIDNTASSNSYGICLSCTILSSSINNTLAGNIANSNHDGGICLYRHSNGTTLTNNTVNSNNGDGIYLFSSSNNILAGNTANSNDGDGLCLSSSSNNNITCNEVQKNTQNGFRLYKGSTGNNIRYNNIIENGNYNATSDGWEWQFYNDQSDPVEAKHSYWGAGMNNSTIDAGIYDDKEGGWGEVEFYPFETDPVPCTPAPKELSVFTTADAVIALQIAVGNREYDRAMDVNDDSTVTSLDAIMILQRVVGNTGIG